MKKQEQYSFRFKSPGDLLPARDVSGGFGVPTEDPLWDERYFKALVEYGKYLLEINEPAAALEILAEAEFLEATDIDVLQYKGLALLRLEKCGKAEKVFEELLWFEPGNPRFRYWLAHSAALLGKRRKALRELRLATEAYPALLREADGDPAFDGMYDMAAFRKLLARPPADPS